MSMSSPTRPTAGPAPASSSCARKPPSSRWKNPAPPLCRRFASPPDIVAMARHKCGLARVYDSRHLESRRGNFDARDCVLGPGGAGRVLVLPDGEGAAKAGLHGEAGKRHGNDLLSGLPQRHADGAVLPRTMHGLTVRARAVLQRERMSL